MVPFIDFHVVVTKIFNSMAVEFHTVFCNMNETQ